MERRELDGLTREELVARAEGLGVARPRLLTKVELIDEIVARTAQSEPERARLRGFLGRARDLLSRVVERGLHMPETARALRGEAPPEQWPPPPPPPPPRSTTTLAEIYASQGHTDRAIAVLDEILARAPEDEDARRLRERLIERAPRGQGAGAEAPGVDAEDADAEDADAEDADAAAEDADAAAEDADAAAEDADAAAEDADSAAAEASPAPLARDDGATEPRGAAIASEHQGQPGPAAGAPGDVPVQLPRDPSPAGVEAPASPVAPGVALGLAAALRDERAELPARYDVDEIVGIAVDHETIYLYWEVRPRTLARARARRPEGQLAIRVVAVMPSWERPVVEQRDLAIDALFGDMFVRDIPSGANLRMCTGWLAGEVFEPFAVGLEVAVPRALPASPRPSSEEPPASVPALTGETSEERPASVSALTGETSEERPASASELTGEIPPGSPGASMNVAERDIEGDVGDAVSPVLDAIAAGTASLSVPGASGEHGEPVAAIGASGGSVTRALRASSAQVASDDVEIEAAAAAVVTSSDVEPAAPAATSDGAAEAVRAAAPRDLEAVAPGRSATLVAEPTLPSPDQAPARFASGTAPTPEAIAQAVAATRGAASEGPARFPSGTAPTPEAIAQAVAATRGGSSELLRGSGGSAGPHASEALRRASAERGFSPGGGPRLGADRGRSLGGGAELWRSFTTPARPPSRGR